MSRDASHDPVTQIQMYQALDALAKQMTAALAAQAEQMDRKMLGVSGLVTAMPLAEDMVATTVKHIQRDAAGNIEFIQELTPLR